MSESSMPKEKENFVNIVKTDGRVLFNIFFTCITMDLA